MALLGQLASAYHCRPADLVELAGGALARLLFDYAVARAAKPGPG